MRSYILFFCLFTVFSIHAQEEQDYQYFKIDYKGNTNYTLSPKQISTHLKTEKTRNKKIPYGLYYNRYEVLKGEELGKTFYLLYKEIFKNMSQEQLTLLRKVSYTLIFNKNIEQEKYVLEFPIADMNRFPEFENLLHQFGEKCMKVDMKPYIRPLLKKEFGQGSFPVPLFWMMRFDKE